jgi:hypothetical protein
MNFRTLLTLAIAALPLLGTAQIDPLQLRQRLTAHMPRGEMNEVIPGQLLVKFAPSMAARFQENASRRERGLRPSFATPNAVPTGTFDKRILDTGWTLWRIPSGADPRQVAKSVAGKNGVIYAQPVHRIYPLLADPNDGDWLAMEDSEELILALEGEVEPYRRLWHLIDTGAHEGWSRWPGVFYTAATKPTSLPTIAVIDTGCDMNHPDFRNALGTSTDSALGGQLHWSKSKRFELGEIVPGAPEDLNGHGTHVTGLAVASANNGSFNGHGMIGTGYNCRAMILRVFNDLGVATDLDAAVAMYYAADNGADIVNLSLGTTSYSQLFQDASVYCWQKGLLVVAAGNENGDGGGDLGPIFPAANSGVLAVTANGENGIPAHGTYSGYGPYVDIAAPGGDVTIDPLLRWYKIQFVWSTASRDPSTTLHNHPVLFPPYNLNYAYLAGTSMAAPQVAGGAGVYYGMNHIRRGNWGNVRAFRALQKSAIGVMGAPYGGWEPQQGYGCFWLEGLLLDYDSREAVAGAIEGICYYNGTPIGNVTVRARKEGSSITLSTNADSRGLYRFEAAMVPGVYRVWAAPFGSLKEKYVKVFAGSDVTQCDFFGGTYTGDETGPVLGRFDWLNLQSNLIRVKHWAYDTETGIDAMSMKMGTTPGGSNLIAETRVFPEDNVWSKDGLSLPRYWFFEAKYVNGNTDVMKYRRARVPNIADTFVQDGSSASTNFGAHTTMRVGRSTVVGGNTEAFIMVNIADVAGTISKATLHLRGFRVGTGSTAPVNVFRTSNTWNEMTMLWGTKPIGIGSSIATANVTSTSATDIAFDITAAAKAARDAGQTTFGLILRGGSTTASAQFYTRERSSGQPIVEIDSTGV